MNEGAATRARDRHVLIAAALILAVAAGLGIYMTNQGKGDEYASWQSPDGRHSVVVLRKRKLLGMMPGQGSDAPGVVQLRDASGAVLEEADVEMVQLVEEPQWSGGQVSIKLVADWKLP